MKFENVRVMNFENALRGMRNPKDSWHLSDSEFGLAPVDDVIKYCDENNLDYNDIILYQNNNVAEYAVIGPKDLKLAQALIKGGSEHRKFLRQIFVTVDITAPLYFWKEFDTYKIGTVANSTSTMHTIHKKPIDIDCFEVGDYDGRLAMIDPSHLGIRVSYMIDDLEQLRQLYLMYHDKAKEEKDPEEKKRLERFAKSYWKELIRWLPESWLQTRTVTMNYEVLLSMASQRKTHKLTEWSGLEDIDNPNFIRFVRQLPYAEELLFLGESND